MLNLVFELLRHIFTLLFGISVSALLLNIGITKKNLWILSIFSVIELALQGLLYITHSVELITMLYPLLIHLPLLLLFIIVFRKSASSSILVITTAYLCCQIANWFSVIPETLNCPVWATDFVYTFVLIISFFFVVRYVATAYSLLLQKSASALLTFGIIPVFYYIFDYISTVYTELLYDGHVIATEFAPFLMSICYLIFCTVYFKQYEEKMNAENLSKLMTLKQKQLDKELYLVKQSEKKIILLRHDMRHFMNNISNYIDNNEPEHAKEYIQSITDSIDSTVIRKYCSNEAVNMILSLYENTMEENHINFSYKLSIPTQLPINDVSLTSILSNGMENALHAVLSPADHQRCIQLNISERNGKILISLSNTFGIMPEIVDGIPVTDTDGHGFGTQSIYYTVEKLKGNCQFSIKDNRFILQIVI